MNLETLLNLENQQQTIIRTFCIQLACKLNVKRDYGENFSIASLAYVSCIDYMVLEKVSFLIPHIYIGKL